MELELGLALPNNHQTPCMMQQVKGRRLDLNCAYMNNNGTDLQMENCNKDASSACFNNNQKSHRYYFVDDEEGEVESSNKGLTSLLLWSGQQPDEDKWRNPHSQHQNMNVKEEENEEIVGWPPIKSLRKELIILHRQHQHQHHHHLHNLMQGNDDDQRMTMNMREGSVGVRNNNSKYVKVKMEGVPIGRKIDLTLYNSYQDLTHSLIHIMFAKYCAGNDSKHGNYIILYQDKQGDWMLAADVPWETFVESVQRLEIIRNVK